MNYTFRELLRMKYYQLFIIDVLQTYYFYSVKWIHIIKIVVMFWHVDKHIHNGEPKCTAVMRYHQRFNDNYLLNIKSTQKTAELSGLHEI